MAKLRSFRQGDVLFYEVSPEVRESIISYTPRRRTDGKIVLALGEATGHKHQVSDKNITFYPGNNTRYLDVHKRSMVLHEEHNPIPLPPGMWEVKIERQYGIGGEVRPVYD